MLHYIVLSLALLAPQRSAATPPPAASAPVPNLSALVDGISRSLATMRTLSADFELFVNQRGTDSGHLYLARGGKMRWEYKKPEARYFISDGNMLYDWVPANRQVNREKVSKSGDDRIPLMFLLGQANLQDEFRRFEEVRGARTILPRDRVVRMFPVNEKSGIQSVELEVEPEPDYTIRRLLVTFVDGGNQEFLFTNVQRNITLQPSLFEFKPDKGVVVVEGLSH